MRRNVMSASRRLVENARRAVVREGGDYNPFRRLNWSAAQSWLQRIGRDWARWRGDAAFLLATLALALLTAVTLSSLGAALTAPPRASRSARLANREVTPSTSGASTSCQASSATVTDDQALSPTSTTTAGVIAATTHDYAVGQANVGFMQGSVDARGDIWVGAMNAKTLDRISAASGSLLICSPPSGAGGIMQTAVDSQGAVWFTEQNANYIGKFTPATQTFTTYSLGQVNGHGVRPQDLAFDANGILWFTELGGGGIGRLDPATGAIRSYPVPAPASGAPSFPFALAITHDGQVWFGDLSGGAVGRLDPVTGAVRLYHLGERSGGSLLDGG